MDDTTGFQIVRKRVEDQGDIPPVLWHYTDPDAFCSIIKNHSLWLSSYLKMNDKLDLRWLCKKLLDDPTLPNAQMAAFVPSKSVCLVSLSADGDKPSQWERYADSGKGMALALDVRTLGFEHPRGGYPRKFYWRVVYNTDAQDAILADIKAIVRPHLTTLSTPPKSQSQSHLGEHSRQRSNAAQQLWMGIRPNITILGSALKDPAYSAEVEWRLVRDCGPIDDAIQQGLIKIRKRGSEEIPYCEQSLIDSEGVSAVKGVRLGPRCDKDEGLIRDFLMAHGVPNPDVDRSRTATCS